LSTACVTEQRRVGAGWELREIKRKEVQRKTMLDAGFTLLLLWKS
jgi:hypothetical protein